MKNLEVDVVPFSAAINACAKGQEWLPALLLLSELNTVPCGITEKRFDSDKHWSNIKLLLVTSLLA